MLMFYCYNYNYFLSIKLQKAFVNKCNLLLTRIVDNHSKGGRSLTMKDNRIVRPTTMLNEARFVQDVTNQSPV